MNSTKALPDVQEYLQPKKIYSSYKVHVQVYNPYSHVIHHHALLQQNPNRQYPPNQTVRTRTSRRTPQP